VKVGAPEGKAFPAQHAAPVMILITSKWGVYLTKSFNIIWKRYRNITTEEY